MRTLEFFSGGFSSAISVYMEVTMSDIKENIRGSGGTAWRISLYFSLNELIVVLFLTAVFSVMLVPLLMGIRSGMKRAVCTDSLMKITRTTLRYSEENGFFPPAAMDNDRMWFGVRYDENSGYDWNDSAIARSLSYRNRYVAMCPEMYQLLRESRYENENKGFGFGYNRNVGSLSMFPADKQDGDVDGKGIDISKMCNPKTTMLFADTATRLDENGRRTPDGEWAMYPFAEPNNFYADGNPVWGSKIPSVHFRHSGKANVTWGDGHVSLEKLDRSYGDWGKSCIGYLGGDDDKAFKPF